MVCSVNISFYNLVGEGDEQSLHLVGYTKNKRFLSWVGFKVKCQRNYNTNYYMEWTLGVACESSKLEIFNFSYQRLLYFQVILTIGNKSTYHKFCSENVIKIIKSWIVYILSHPFSGMGNSSLFRDLGVFHKQNSKITKHFPFESLY